jgi:hypothetical protein
MDYFVNEKNQGGSSHLHTKGEKKGTKYLDIIIRLQKTFRVRLSSEFKHIILHNFFKKTQIFIYLIVENLKR